MACKRLSYRVLALVLALSWGAFAVPASAGAVSAASAPVAHRLFAASASSSLADDVGLVIVKPRPGSSITALADGRKARGGAYVVRAPRGQTGAAYAASLARNANVEYAVPDYIRHVLAYTSSPNDPDFTDTADHVTSWGGVTTMLAHGRSWWIRGAGSCDFDVVWPDLTADGATVAYHARATGPQVKVGVIDTGFYFDHPDAGGNIVTGKDLFSTYTSATDVRVTDNDVTPVSPSAPGNSHEIASHGTMTASEIAQGTDNGLGGAAASFDAQVRVYKVQGVWIDGDPNNPDPLLRYPAGSAVIMDDALDDAIRLAADDGCRVISISLGGADDSLAMQDAIDYAYAKGVLVVAATGNDGTNVVSYPGADTHVMGVGAYALGGGGGTSPATIPTKTDFSNSGTGTDILAPGEDVWGPTYPGWDEDGSSHSTIPSYRWWSGTSMATPLAAAAAALTLRFAPGLGPDDVAEVLQSSAVDMGAAGYDLTNGWGKLDMAAAYERLKAEYPNLARPQIAGVVSGGSYQTGDFSLSWPAIPGYLVKYVVTQDGSALPSSSATAVSLTGLADGLHTVTVAPLSTRNWSAGSATTVTFTVDGMTRAAIVGVTPPASTLLHYAGRATFSGTLAGPDGQPLPGVAVLLERSLDAGTTWSRVLAPITDGNGAWTATWVPGRNMLVRARYAGDATRTPGVSITTSLRQLVYLGYPHTPSRVTHRRAFATHVYLKPRFTSGTHPVKVYFYRHERQRNGTYEWVLRKTVSARASNYSSYTRCSFSTSVPYAGKWKAVARYAGSAAYAATTSNSRYFTAR